jgi:hypothetical protein
MTNHSVLMNKARHRLLGGNLNRWEVKTYSLIFCHVFILPVHTHPHCVALSIHYQKSLNSSSHMHRPDLSESLYMYCAMHGPEHNAILTDFYRNWGYSLPIANRIMHYIICLQAKFQDNLRKCSREHHEDEVCNAFQA